MTDFPVAHTADQAVNNIMSCECTQIKEAFPADTITATLKQITEIYSLLEAISERVGPGFQKNSIIAPDALPPDICGPLGYDIIDYVENLVSSNVPGQVLRTLTGGKIVHHPASIRIRRHIPERTLATYVPWHQDASFMGDDHIWFTCWIPLTPCGPEAPALDFIPHRTTFGFLANADYDLNGYGMGGISESDISEKMGDKAEIWRPAFNLGDCMLFTYNTLHRTSPAASGAKPRLSMEIRFRADR